jgi:hypothetical protein
MTRREAGRRARGALAMARASSPMRTRKISMHGWVIESSGQTRNLWFGYYLAYREVATGRGSFVDS